MPRLGRRLFRLGLSGSFGLDEAGCREALERVQYVFWSPRMKALTPALLERRRPAAVAYTATAWRKLLRAPRGLVAMFGCAHAGYVNILKAVRTAFPDKKLLSVVGGLHLGSANDQVLAEAVAFTGAFKAEGFTFYGGHCTGGKTIAYFKETFGDDAVKPLGAGRVIQY